MALNTASEGNFSTKNHEEATRLIENLASNSNTKNTDFERKKSTPSMSKEQIEEVKAKLDSFQKFLRKQRQYNQGFNRKSYGNGQRNNFNQSSQRRPFNNNITYESSYYQNPTPGAQGSKIEAMVDRVLERQQKMIVDSMGR
ncbi:hypothetical protein N665_0121s0006 [Sinapis alba]|nr:hypothetical protein N665_0121s0006 [Sinapis alba]